LRAAGWAALLVAGAEKQQTLASAQALPAAFPVGLLLGRPQGLDVYWSKV
jgi:6-phosphogluconolactonase